MYYVPVAMLKDENEVIKDLQVRLAGALGDKAMLESARDAVWGLMMEATNENPHDARWLRVYDALYAVMH
jgi:hypothetical protein